MPKDKVKKRERRESAPSEDDLIERGVVALEHIADVLDELAAAAIYRKGKDVSYVGVSVNHDPDVIGDDAFSPDGQEEEDDEDEEPESGR